jgi:hypothetical protein
VGSTSKSGRISPPSVQRPNAGKNSGVEICVFCTCIPKCYARYATVLGDALTTTLCYYKYVMPANIIFAGVNILNKRVNLHVQICFLLIKDNEYEKLFRRQLL